jgi:hypothetical protein
MACLQGAPVTKKQFYNSFIYLAGIDTTTIEISSAEHPNAQPITAVNLQFLKTAKFLSNFNWQHFLHCNYCLPLLGGAQ